MAEQLYDLDEQCLVSGVDPYADEMHGFAPERFVPLAEIALHGLPGDTQFKTPQFLLKQLNDTESLTSYGQWVLGLLGDGTPASQLTRTVLDNIAASGLGPDSQVPKRRFGSRHRFQAAVAAPDHSAHLQDPYTGWSRQRRVRYLARIEKSVRRAPTEADVIRRHEVGEGPSLRSLTTATPLRELREELGYPNVHAWDKDDAVDWGVDVRRANAGEQLCWIHVDILGAKRRGPSYRYILKTFGSWAIYRDAVNAAFQQKGVSYEAQVEGYRDEVNSSYDLMSWREIDDKSLLRNMGCLRVIQQIIPHTTESELVKQIGADNFSLIKTIKRYNPTISKDDIELNAETLGVYDDIWPSSLYMKRLYVSPDELAVVRAREADKTRARKKRRNECLVA